jgi:hypothetical protein
METFGAAVAHNLPHLGHFRSYRHKCGVCLNLAKECQNLARLPELNKEVCQNVTAVTTKPYQARRRYHYSRSGRSYMTQYEAVATPTECLLPDQDGLSICSPIDSL